MASESPVAKPEVPEGITSFYRPRKSLHDLSAPWRSLEVSVSLVNRGLLNPTGENNCFLNSVVQILWHIDVFRRSFREIRGHSCVGKSCIFCALKALFSQFQHGNESAIPPDVLRSAMATCYEEQHRFQLGLMDDAAECFEKILEQVHFHLTGDDDLDTCIKPFCLPHIKFSLTILERTECVCGATSEPLSFVQFVHYVSAPAIVVEAKKVAELTHEKKSTFGKILNAASCFGETKQCPNFSKCKRMVKVKRILLNCPDVLCLGLIWDSDRPSVDDLMSVVNTVGLNLQLTDVFDHVFVDSAQFNQYELTAIIAYYGRHYSTFCFHSRLQEWIYFDDAKFRVIGAEWSDVVEQIRRGHYQPLLLVYTNPFADTVDIAEAPVEVSIVDQCQKKVPAAVGGRCGDQPTSAAEGEAVVVTTKESVPTAQIAVTNSTKSTTAMGKSSATTNAYHINDANSTTSSNTPHPIKLPQETIDPLTLSIVPSLTTSRTGISPVSGRPRPSKKSHAPPVVSQHVAGGEEDLMMFSVSPAAGVSGLGVRGAQPSDVAALKPPAAPLNSPSGSEPECDEHADLIQFSVSPRQVAQIRSKYRASPVSHVQPWPAHSAPVQSGPITPRQPKVHQTEGRKRSSNPGQAQSQNSKTLPSGSHGEKPGAETLVQYSEGDWHVLSLRKPKPKVAQSRSGVASRSDVMKLQESTREALSQARDIWAKVEALIGSDNVVALTLCSQYTGLLLQVLQDPAVAANVALREQISNKRAEGYQMLETLRARAKSASTTSGVFGECVQCGKKRSLKNSVCGPCHLRAKVNYPS